MIVSLIVAMDEQGGIGKEGHLPWRLSSDLQRFKRLTMGHTLIMGRKTWEAIDRPLVGRTNVVVTRNPQYHPAGCLVAASLDNAFALAQEAGESEVFIIGGGEIFAQAITNVERIYLTVVHAEVTADVFFPPYAMAEWRVVDSCFHPADEKNDFPTTFYRLEKREYNFTSLPVEGVGESTG